MTVRTTVIGAAALAFATSCVPSPRMCSTDTDCGAQASCVSGRCVVHGSTPAIVLARRLLFEPADEGWVRRGGEGLPSAGVATLGRDDGAVVFLRFSLPLARPMNVVEGYLLLERAPGLDIDPMDLTLHAALVEGAWDGRSLSWARQPVTVDLGAPLTRVAPGAKLVRLDVRAIVERWRRRDRADFGLAVLADGSSPTGLPLALEPFDVPADRDDPVLSSPPSPPTQPPSPFEPRPPASVLSGDARRQVHGPRLELYVR